MVFCDFSKAFDKIWHKGLLYKLDKYGIAGNINKWFASYLDGRKQKVLVNGSTSSWKEIKAGVPQGTVLGPLLFLLYINDLPDNLDNPSRLFADDTSLLKVHRPNEDVTMSLNQDMEKINIWTKQWKMSLNPKKTEAMTISNFRNPQVQNLSIDNH